MTGIIAMMLVTVAVMLVQLLGAVRTLEFVAFAGNAQQGNGHQQQGEKFHRAAS